MGDNANIKQYSFHILNILTLIILVKDSSAASNHVSHSERYEYKNPNQYSFATIHAMTHREHSLQRCAAACNRHVPCDGFYYRQSDTSCIVSSHFIRRPTTFVDPHSYRMYLRSSYVLTTVCPTHDGFRMITAGSKSYCLWENDLKGKYFDAQARCQSRGASLLYLGGDIAGNLNNLYSILTQLGTNWKNGWGGAHQKDIGSDQWVWSYGGASMTSHELNSYTWSDAGGAGQKCMGIDSENPSYVELLSCSIVDQSICEIVLF